MKEFSRENRIRIDAFNKEYGVDNTSFILFDKDGIFYEDIRDEEEYFKLCTLTFMFTSISIFQLVDKGLINIYDDVRDYLKDFSILPHDNTDNYVPVTIKDLLLNRSGLQTDNLTYLFCDIDYHNIIGYLKGQSLKYKSGLFSSSSSIGYLLLALVVEEVSKMDILSYFRKYIFEPLGLNVSYIDEANTTNKNELYHLYSTIHDIAIVGSMLMNKGIYKDVRVLEEDTVMFMLTYVPLNNILDYVKSDGFILSHNEYYNDKIEILSLRLKEYVDITLFVLPSFNEGFVIKSSPNVPFDYLNELISLLFTDIVSINNNQYLKYRVEDSISGYLLPNKVFTNVNFLLDFKTNKSYISSNLFNIKTKLIVKADNNYSVYSNDKDNDNEDLNYYLSLYKITCLKLYDKDIILEKMIQQYFIQYNIYGTEFNIQDRNESWDEAIGCYTIIDKSLKMMFYDIEIEYNNNAYLLSICNKSVSYVLSVVNDYYAVVQGYSKNGFERVYIYKDINEITLEFTGIVACKKRLKK